MSAVPRPATATAPAAEAALDWRLLERPADARRALAVVARARSAGGWLYATREARVSTRRLTP